MRTLAAILATAFLAACGSSGSTDSQSASAGPTPDLSTLVPSTLGPDGGGPEAQKSADDIFADAMRQLASAPSVHMDISNGDSTGTFSATMDLTPATGHVVLTNPSGSITTVVIVGGQVFESQGSGAFVALGIAAVPQFLSLLPPQIASCAQRQHGVLTKGSVFSLGGRQVIEIRDDGNAPGDIPAKDYISLGDPIELLQSNQSGPTMAGGAADCANPSGTPASTQVTTLDYSRPAAVVTPPPT